MNPCSQPCQGLRLHGLVEARSAGVLRLSGLECGLTTMLCVSIIHDIRRTLGGPSSNQAILVIEQDPKEDLVIFRTHFLLVYKLSTVMHQRDNSVTGHLLSAVLSSCWSETFHLSSCSLFRSSWIS